MSPLRVRREALADDSLVVARGGELSAATLHHDAVLCFRRFGEYGISVLAAPDDVALDQLAAAVLQRFETLTITTVGALRETGLEVRPTFRRPHHSVMLVDLEADVERLMGCENVQRRNFHYQAPEP